MGHKTDRDKLEDEREDEDEEEEDESRQPARPERGGRKTSGIVQLLAAIGFMALGAVIIPALWGLFAEAPNLRRYVRIMRM